MRTPKQADWQARLPPSSTRKRLKIWTGRSCASRHWTRRCPFHRRWNSISCRRWRMWCVRRRSCTRIELSCSVISEVLAVNSYRHLAVATLLLSLAVNSQGASSRRMQLKLPNSPGFLEVNVGSLPVYQRLSPNGQEQMLMGDVGEHLKDGLSITAFLQRVEFRASPSDCRKERWAQRKWPPGEQPTNVKFSEGEGFSRIDHDILEIQGHKVNVHS